MARSDSVTLNRFDLNSERMDSQRVGNQRVGNQRVNNQRVDGQRVDSQRVDSQRVDSQRVDGQRQNKNLSRGALDWEVIPNTADDVGDQHEEEAVPSDEFIRETISSLVNKYGPDAVIEQSTDVTSGKKRKRQYKSKSENYNAVLRSRLKELELSCRASFLINLNNSESQRLYDYFITEMDTPKDLKGWISDVTKCRISSNFNTWKYRVIDNLIAHVRALNKEDNGFKKARTKSVAASFIESKFNLESFAMTFDFVKGWLDLKASSSRVQKFCKLAYVELVSYAKMHTIWLDDKNRPEESEYSRRGLANRLVTCTSSKRWAKYIPTLDEIVFVQHSRGYKRPKKKAEQFKSPDEDDELYVMEDSDEEQQSNSDMDNGSDDADDVMPL
ncbi:hypothetical protein GGR50DRAFT_698827 [Xylaria sp. CBS 124048]|nr:hypothetical protein GGR50DRAFT_698827 [Xylaria sp. CBS 124048]